MMPGIKKMAHVVFWGLLKFGNKKARIDLHYGLL
jgi:hypothetical protein